MIHLSLRSTLLIIYFSLTVATIIPTFDKIESSIVQILGNTTNAISFSQFARKYEKKYKSIRDIKHRFSIYSKNLELIELTNKKNLFYTLAVNEMADWSWEEIKQYRLGVKIPNDFSANRKVNYTFTNTALPEKKDWRDEHIISPVKNQGSCGSCWAFSATAAMEAAYSQAHKRGISFSEQQLIDCAKSLNNGCKSGRPDHAFEYILNAGGISTDLAYPYTESDTNLCKFTDSMITGVLEQYGFLPDSDEDALKDTIANLRPVSVVFNAKQEFAFYHGGIYKTYSCGQELSDMNHAMLIVGYGVESSVPYWIVKNSWGTTWGEQGYGKVLMGVNLCGIANFPVVPQFE